MQPEIRFIGIYTGSKFSDLTGWGDRITVHIIPDSICTELLISTDLQPELKKIKVVEEIKEK